MKNIFFFLIILIAVSCSKKEEVVPADILPADKMIPVLADMHLAEATIQLRNYGHNDSTKNLAYGFYRFIFQKHKLTEAEFHKSFTWYSQRPEKMHAIYQEVLSELSRKQASVTPVKPAG